MTGGSAGLRYLARSLHRQTSDRRRRTWLTLALAGAGTMAMAAAAVAGMAGTDQVCVLQDAGVWSCPEGSAALARYLTEPGLRVGVVLGALFLVVPFAVLAVQALRFGSAARERRGAALVLAGAGPREVRWLGALEAVRAAVPGAVLALPGWLGLWAVAGLAPPAGWRLAPPSPVDGLLAWPVTAAGILALAWVAGAVSARAATLTPRGQVRRAPHGLGRREVVLVGAIWVGLAAAVRGMSRWPTGPLPLVALTLLLWALVSSGPVLVAAAGRASLRRPDPVSVLVGRRLSADPRTPGRVAGVLLAVGTSLGIEALFVASILDTVPADLDGYGGEVAFYLQGVGFAVVATVVAALVAVASLVIGAVEQVVDTARPTAVLMALGADSSVVRAVLRRQLLVSSALPVSLGVGLGWMVGARLSPVSAEVGTPCLVAGFGLALGLSLIGVLVADRVLRPDLEDAMSVTRLRSA